MRYFIGIGLLLLDSCFASIHSIIRTSMSSFKQRWGIFSQYTMSVNNISKMIGLKNNKFLVKDLPPGVCFVKSSGKELKLLKIKL